MDAYEYLTLSRDGHITIVNLDRPDARNALNYDFLNEIEQCALSFRDDPETRVVVFAANGRHFSAGADLNEMQNAHTHSIIEKRRRLRMGERVLRAILGIDQISICAWNGGAIGGGGCLAMATDFRFGAEDCFVLFPEIDLGLNLMWQSLPRTVRLVGESRALRLAIGGERVAAQTLLDWGILEAVVPNADLMRQVLEFAQIYANKPPVAAQMIKRSVNAIGGYLDQALMHMDADQHLLASLTDDHQVAVEAYLEKRAPKFSGR